VKVVNIKSMNTSTPVDIADRQSCWYVNLENIRDRSKTQWVVGVKKDTGEKSEYTFKLSEAKDVYDDVFWNYGTSKDFAIKLISLFRNGGKSSVTSWIKSGCP